jgi:hypothetical protein
VCPRVLQISTGIETTEADIRAIYIALLEGRIAVAQFRDWIIALALPPKPEDQLKRSIALLMGARNRLDFWMDGTPEAETIDSLRQLLALVDGEPCDSTDDPLLPYKQRFVRAALYRLVS